MKSSKVQLVQTILRCSFLQAERVNNKVFLANSAGQSLLQEKAEVKESKISDMG